MAPICKIVIIRIYTSVCCCYLPCDRDVAIIHGIMKKCWPMVIGCVLHNAGSFLHFKLYKSAYFDRNTQLLPPPWPCVNFPFSRIQKNPMAVKKSFVFRLLGGDENLEDSSSQAWIKINSHFYI